MITRRTTLKLLAVAASADCQRLSAEESSTDDPVPYFMKWPATDKIAAKLEQFRKEASCDQGKILLRQMFLVRPDADKKPEIVKTLPDEDGEFEVQLCISFRVTCVPNVGKYVVTSTLTAPDLELVVSKGPLAKVTLPSESEAEAQKFWFQTVENIEADPPHDNSEARSLALELGLTKSSNFAAEQADSPPHTWKVVCFTGAWFSIDVKDKKMAGVKPLTGLPQREITVEFVETAIPKKQ